MAIRYKTCINCGSRHTAKIIYGLPTSELIPLVDAKKVILGGCCISIESKSFSLIDALGGRIGEYLVDSYLPEYLCHTCNFEWSKEQAIYNAYSKMKSMKVKVGSFSEGYHQVEIDFINRVIIFKQGYEREIQEKKLEVYELADLIYRLKEVRLLHWKANYRDSFILDGTQWAIEIIYPTKTLSKSGSNQFPKEWKEFTRLLNKLTNIHFS